MGLDQNAGKLKHEYKYEFTNKEGEKSTHKWTNVGPFEWRKHARLQEFMTRLYMKRKRIKNKWYDRGNDEWYPIEFGKTNRLRLKPQDIDSLEKAVNNGYMDYFCDGGFFWGHQSQEDSAKYYREQDLKFIEYARDRFESGKAVYYICSW